MPRNYTVIKNNAMDAILYHEDNSIVMEISTGQKKTIASGVLEDFSVSQTPKGNHLIFYREKNGDAFLSKLSLSGTSNSKHLLSCDAFTKSYSCIYGQSEILGSCFFYTLPSSKHNVYSLHATNFSSDETVTLEDVMPLKERPFYFVSDNSPVVIYKNPQNMLILCVFNGDKLQDYKKYILSRRADTIKDVSCLIKDGKIHITYIIEQMGKSYLIYKNIDKEIMDANQNLNCQKNLTNCTMFFSKDTLFVFSISKDTSYCAFSKDFGGSFSNSAIYFKHVSSTTKAHFICQNNGDLFTQEIFIDGSTPLLIENYYNPPKIKVITSDDKIKKLESKIKTFENEIKQKNLQMMKMSKNVNSSQQPNTAFMQQINKNYEEINMERNRLLQSVAQLQIENKNLKAQIKKDNDTSGSPDIE